VAAVAAVLLDVIRGEPLRPGGEESHIEGCTNLAPMWMIACARYVGPF
jgi:hypothetical protein